MKLDMNNRKSGACWCSHTQCMPALQWGRSCDVRGSGAVPSTARTLAVSFYTIINYPRQHNNLLLLYWTTCFDQLIGHPQVLIYCEVFREPCARFWDPKWRYATYMYEFSYMYTKMVLTPMLVSVLYESTWDPKNVHMALWKLHSILGPEDDHSIGRNM